MRLLAMLCAAAIAASAATTYTATSLQVAGSPYQIANVYGLNNEGQVLVDLCANGNCFGANRLLGLWSNGVITPLAFPPGLTYSPNGQFYHINDSGTVVGVGAFTATNGGSAYSTIVWTNGVPAVLPNAPYSSGFGGEGCPSSANGSSVAWGINAAGHIVGSTTYSNSGTGLDCSAFWLYNGSGYQVLTIPIPSQCNGLPQVYYPGVTVYNPLTLNDADQVLGTLQNIWCGPPYISPGWGPIGETDPFVLQTDGASSFLSLGGLGNGTGFTVNDSGTVLGGWNDGDGFADLLVWDNNGLHEFPGGYGNLNKAGQVVYLTSRGLCGGGQIALWQSGVSTVLELPAGLFNGCQAPSGLNDAGQFTAGLYLLSPSATMTAAAPATVNFSPASQNLSLNATVTSTGGTINSGSVVFTVAGVGTVTSGTVINGAASAALTVPAGTPAGTYSLQAAYSGAPGFGPSNEDSDTLTILQATPVLTWAAPAAITFGSALSSGQLDATASVPGTFVYNPPAGTVLQAGAGQTLSATFTPTDTADYTTAGTSTTITVNPAAPPASPANLVVTRLLARSGGNVAVELTIANTGGTGANNVVLANVKVGADVATPLPQNLGTIAAGASIQAAATVPGSVGASGAASSLTVSGTYTGGTFSSSSRITLP